MKAQELPDICRLKHGRNALSEAANKRVHRSKYELRELLYQWVLMQGNRGGTCEEASNALGVRYTTASARLSELKADRWLVPTGERRKTTGGSSAAVLRAQTKAEREGTIHPPMQLELLQTA
jgi:hypothetical protein